MTTWPTPRDGLCWGTSELTAAAALIEAPTKDVTAFAKTNGRRLETVQGRIHRLRQHRDQNAQAGAYRRTTKEV